MKRSRLILSLIVSTMALAVLSLSFSLAWYASSDRLLINTIDVNIDTDAHLRVSTSPELDSFKESLEQSELNTVEEFIPTSSMYQSRWMNDKSDTPIFYDTSSDTAPLGVPTVEPSEKGYFQQKFYLLSDRNYYATLSGVDSLFSADKDANSLRAQALQGEINDLSSAQIEEKLDDLVNCLRVSILVTNEEYYGYYIVDPTKDEDKPTYYAGLLDNNGDGYFDTYEVNDNNQTVEKEIIYGEVENRENISYDDPTSNVLIPNENYDAFKNHFFGNSFEGKSKETAYTFNEKQSFASGVTYKEEPSLSLADLEANDNPLLIPCFIDQPTEIVVSIYVEGWDKDCYNSTMGASFNSTLSFKLLRGII